MRRGVVVLMMVGLLMTACERKGLAPKPTVAALMESVEQEDQLFAL